MEYIKQKLTTLCGGKRHPTSRQPVSELLTELQSLDQPLHLCYPKTRHTHFLLRLPEGFDGQARAILSTQIGMKHRLLVECRLVAPETNDHRVALVGKSLHGLKMFLTITRATRTEDHVIYDVKLRLSGGGAIYSSVIHGR